MTTKITELTIVDANDGIHNARVWIGMSQKSLAQRLGISRNRLGDYELGYKPIPMSLAEKIAEALGMTLGEVFWSAKVTRAA